MRYVCNYGSGAALTIGANFGHVVIAIDEDRRRNSIAMTPETMRALANHLLSLAADIDTRVLADKSKSLAGEQWTDEQKRILEDQGRPPSVFNRIKPIIADAP